MKMIQPYTGIAPFYDLIMEHVDYRLWSRHILNIIANYSNTSNYIADLSCGTGSLLYNMYKKRKRLFAADRSLPMLRVARQKFRQQKTHVICSNLCYTALKPNLFDVILVLYDTVNYLTEDKEVKIFLDEMWRLLETGGVLIFDIATLYICNKAFRDYHENHHCQGTEIIRHSWFRESTMMQYNRFEIKNQSDFYTEDHVQKIRTNEEWGRLIKRSRLKMIGSLHNFTFKDAREDSERVHFICRKEA